MTTCDDHEANCSSVVAVMWVRPGNKRSRKNARNLSAPNSTPNWRRNRTTEWNIPALLDFLGRECQSIRVDASWMKFVSPGEDREDTRLAEIWPATGGSNPSVLLNRGVVVGGSTLVSEEIGCHTPCGECGYLN